MMQMLAAGGLPVLTDGLRAPDADNPRGYFEFEPVKTLARDASWLRNARGKAVKIVSALLRHLPADLPFRVIFMRRPIEAVLASQKKMLVRRGRPAPSPEADQRLGELFAAHVEEAVQRIRALEHACMHVVDFPELLQQPPEVAAGVHSFLDRTLDVGRMTAAVDATLWRQR